MKLLQQKISWNMNPDKEVVSAFISLVNIQSSCFVELLGVLTIFFNNIFIFL